MAATTVAPMQSLAQQIAQQQAELEALQREYQNRQMRLAELVQRKVDLKAKLQEIEASIQATRHGQAAGAASVPALARPASGTAGTGPRPRAHSLPSLLLDIVGAASGPMTIKELSREVKRRKFPTKSTNLSAMVDVRVRELIRNGLLRKAEGQPGVVSASAPPTGARTFLAVSGRSKNGRTAPRKAPARTGGKRQGPSLRERLTNLLAKAKRPVPARELAQQVLAHGYVTTSKNFNEVIWVMLGQMKNVKNVSGEGYVLRR